MNALPLFASLLGRAALLLALLAPAAGLAVEPVRVVATGGRIGYTFYTPAAANTAFRHRTAHKLGGPVAEIRIGFMDWMYTDKTETANATNDVTITHAWLERASTGQVVPLTFSGQRELVLPQNSTTPLWLSDPVPSSVWTGAAPARDEVFWLHARGTIPEGGKVPVGTPVGFAGSRFVMFPPANDPGTIDVAGAVPTIAGGATRSDGLPVIFLGRFTGPGHLSVIGIGDSILHGTGDSTSSTPIAIVGSGFFNRAALDSNGENAIAMFNLTRHGQTAAAWISPGKQSRQTPFLQYANVVVEEYGTNDLGSGGTGTPSTILGRLETIWSAARAAGVQKIVRTLLLPRTSSTDSWSTLAGQTPNNGWAAGGKRDEINDGLRAALAAGKIDVLVDTLAVLADPADDTRWLTNGAVKYVTTDGTHVGPTGNALLAPVLRAALLSLTVDDYPAWTARFSWNGADTAPEADADEDGYANLLEYALGTDPTSAESTPLPGLQVSSSGLHPSTRLSLTFTPVVISGLAYVVQTSSDLLAWDEHPIPSSELVAGVPYVYTDDIPLGVAPRRFLRLRVTL